MNQQLRIEAPRSAWRAASHGSAALALEPAGVAVLVSWSARTTDGETALESREIELVTQHERGFDTPGGADWTCRMVPEPTWVEAISRSLCAEVVLTASALNSPSAQQAVFELAGFLTRRLERTRPVVRVRFQSPPPARRRPTRAWR